MYNTVLFDLDGTITKSEQGIFNSIKYMANKLGLPVPDQKTLYSFIGPPLQKSFRLFYGVGEKESQKMATIYREYYLQKGIFECELYPEVKELLIYLKQKGVKIYLATCKPQQMAESILKYFNIDGYFSGVFGAFLTEHGSDKTSIISRALAEAGCQKSTAVMVGDTFGDTFGATQNGIESLGVLYGYGSREELLKGGAKVVVQSALQLKEFI